jgi:hypothetical protein
MNRDQEKAMFAGKNKSGLTKEQVGLDNPTNLKPPKKDLSSLFSGKSKPDINIYHKNWTLDIENGKVTGLSLGNMTDAGWYWHLNDNDANESLNTFLIRVANSGIKDEFIETMKKENVDFNIFKKQILINLSKPLKNDETSDDGLYTLSGDANNWKFGQESDSTSTEESFLQDVDDDDDADKIREESYMHQEAPQYQDWLEKQGGSVRKQVIELLNNAYSFESYFDELNSEEFTHRILTDRLEFNDEYEWKALSKAVDVLKEKGELKHDTLVALGYN